MLMDEIGSITMPSLIIILSSREFSHPVPCESVVLVSYLRVSSG